MVILKDHKLEGAINLDDHTMWILDRLSATPLQKQIHETRVWFIKDRFRLRGDSEESVL